MKANEIWQAYSCDADDEAVLRLYFAKYGQVPAHVVRKPHIVYAGPLDDEIREE